MTKQIDVPEEVYNKLEERAKDKGFESAEGYINDILKQVVVKLEEENNSEEVYSEEDEERVKERLKALGYLD